jgi:hypothetical protein
MTEPTSLRPRSRSPAVVTDAGTQALTTVVHSAALALSAVPAACSAQTVQSYPPTDKTPQAMSRDVVGFEVSPRVHP